MGYRLSPLLIQTSRSHFGSVCLCLCEILWQGICFQFPASWSHCCKQVLVQFVLVLWGAGEQTLGMNYKTPELTCVLPDLLWGVKANLCWKIGFADGGNNPLLPRAWRRGWCPLVNGSWLTPSPTASSSSTPAITTCFLPCLRIHFSFNDSAVVFCSVDFCLWMYSLCLCPLVLAVGPHWKPSLNIKRSQGENMFNIFYSSQNCNLEWIYLKTI